MRAIDVHCHFLPEEYTEALRKYGRINDDGFPCPEWNINMQLEYMEKAQISHAVLSISSPHPWFGDAVECAELCRIINESAGVLCRKYPELFSWAALLPLPDAELSLKEAKYALEEGGACAVKFPSQAAGVYPGDERLEPLMEYLNERRAVIILHPTRPAAVPEGCFTSGPLPLLEFINDTTRAVVNLIAAGALEKYEGIRVVVPHCGSFLPNIIDRLEGITGLLASKGIGKPVNVRKSLASLYFDTAGDALPRGIQILRTMADEDHILFGGDFPYTPIPMIAEKKRRMDGDPGLDGIRENLYRKNAERLFGPGRLSESEGGGQGIKPE